jgi:hypothetical protein
MITNYKAMDSIRELFNGWQASVGISTLDNLPFDEQFYVIRKIFEYPLVLTIRGESGQRQSHITNVRLDYDTIYLNLSDDTTLKLLSTGASGTNGWLDDKVVLKASWSNVYLLSLSPTHVVKYIGTAQANFNNVVLVSNKEWLLTNWEVSENIVTAKSWNGEQCVLDFNALTVTVNGLPLLNPSFMYPIEVKKNFYIPVLPATIPLDKYIESIQDQGPYIAERAFVKYVIKFNEGSTSLPTHPSSSYLDTLLEDKQYIEPAPFYQKDLTAFKEFLFLNVDPKEPCASVYIKAFVDYSTTTSAFSRKLMAAKSFELGEGDGKAFFISTSKQFLTEYHLPSLGQNISQLQEDQVLEYADNYLDTEWGNKDFDHQEYWNLLSVINSENKMTEFQNPRLYSLGGYRETVKELDNSCVQKIDILIDRFKQEPSNAPWQFGV